MMSSEESCVEIRTHIDNCKTVWMHEDDNLDDVKRGYLHALDTVLLVAEGLIDLNEDELK